MPMTQVQFDDWAARVQTAQSDLIDAQDARDALSGGVAAAEAAMEAAVGDVLAKARDLDILAIEFKNAYSDATDVTPYVVLVGPIDEAQDVAVDAPIFVQFSKPMDPATVTTSSVHVYDVALDDNIALDSVTLDEVGMVASVVPDGNLDWFKEYKIIVDDTVTDADGNAMANAFEQAAAWKTIND